MELRCSDNGHPILSIEISLTVPVVDVNERPNGILIGNSRMVSLNENPIPGESVGVLQCSDPDSGQLCSFELLGDANEYFQVCGPD